MMKTDGRKLTGKALVAVRVRAAKAVVEGGMTRCQAATLFGVSRQIVGEWVTAYKSGGESSLQEGKRGRPEGGGKLAPWQAAQTAKVVIDHHPEQLKLPYFLWTRAAVALYVEERFGIRLSLATVGRYLARWGMTAQKPVRRAYERSASAVKEWMESEYPAISRKAKREGALLLWGDEMGLRSDHATGTSFSPKGETPVVHGTGQRFGCNMISAISNRGQLYFMIFHEGFRVAVFLEFLRRVIRQAGRKVYLIVDGHPVHRSKKVQQWQEAHAKDIRLFRLPAYSPDLNPDEMLNNDVKSNAVGRKRAKDRPQLIRNVHGYLRSRQKTPEMVRRYFHAKTVRYAA
jgi:transposase